MPNVRLLLKLLMLLPLRLLYGPLLMLFLMVSLLMVLSEEVHYFLLMELSELMLLETDSSD